MYTLTAFSQAIKATTICLREKGNTRLWDPETPFFMLKREQEIVKQMLIEAPKGSFLHSTIPFTYHTFYHHTIPSSNYYTLEKIFSATFRLKRPPLKKQKRREVLFTHYTYSLV